MARILLGVGLVCLLVVVALVSRSHPFELGRGAPAGEAPSRWLVAEIAAFMVIGSAIAGTAFAYRFWLRRNRARMAPTHWLKRLLVDVVSVATIAVVAGLTVWLVHEIRGTGLENGEQRRPPALPATVEERSQDVRAAPASSDWVPVAIGGGVGLAAVAICTLLLVRRGAPRRPREPEGASEVAAALARPLADLAAERDPRRAVIAAYASMEHVLAASGIPRQASEAPLEYLGRVLVVLRASSASVRRLTDLFERARFSRHRIDESMRDEAIAALTAVRAELGGAG